MERGSHEHIFFSAFQIDQLLRLLTKTVEFSKNASNDSSEESTYQGKQGKAGNRSAMEENGCPRFHMVDVVLPQLYKHVSIVWDIITII